MARLYLNLGGGRRGGLDSGAAPGFAGLDFSTVLTSGYDRQGPQQDKGKGDDGIACSSHGATLLWLKGSVFRL